jgi:hypothetical protein
VTALEEVAARRAVLAEVEAAIRGSANDGLKVRRAEVLARLTEARAVVAEAEPPEARDPVLLLPVRLETRFAWQDPSGPGRHTFARPAATVATPLLLVRIYPDDVHVDQHDAVLTRQELGWLREYLKAAAVGRDRQDFVAAWERLVERAGPTRAAWIVHQRPPAHPVIVEGKLGRAARATLLPDRFEAIVDVRGGPRIRATGELVREPLDVTPDPALGADGLRWMTDLGDALKAGTAITVALPATQRSEPPALDRVVVVGVHASRDATASSAELARLLDAHHYTTGLSFVRPGAATNATPGERTDRTTTPPIERVFAVEGDMSPLTPPATLVDVEPSDGLEAARLLGVDPAVFGHVAGADGRVRQGGRDLRRLIASAWHGPVERLFATLVTPGQLLEAVNLYVEEVDALGPLPVLRVGDQPYGVLPVSVLSPEDPDLSAPERGVLDAVRALRTAVWDPAAERAPRIGGPPADPTATLLSLLRQDGVLAELAVRPALGPETATALTSTFDTARTAALLAARARVDALVAALAPAATTPSAGALLLLEGLPVTLPLVGPAPHADLDRLSLFDPDPLALLELAFGQPQPEPSVLATIARLALVESADRATRELLLADGQTDAATVARWDREWDDGTIPFYELSERLSTPLSTDPSAPLYGLLIGRAPPAGSEPFLVARGAVRSLAMPPGGVPGGPIRHDPELLETLLRAELGAIATRLDTWITALATRRLRRQRSLAGRERTLVVGAYGLLIDVVPVAGRLRPATKDEVPADHAGEAFRSTSDAGWVHAPSVSHAVTTAVLRSAHLGHWRLAPATGKDAFSIDLSSRRVRTAMHLLAGVREGQPLAALLGYRIERRLRDLAPAGIAVVRRVAPLVAGKLTAGPAGHATADSVVDALTLLERVGEPTAASVAAALTPHRGGVTDADWPGVLAAVTAAVEDARDAVDAVADLLVAEGVFQLVQGNPARSAGAVDAIAAAGPPPPVPAVVDSVRGGTAAVHRVIVTLPVPDAAEMPPDDPAGWALTPRAELEPALEVWARSVLPPAPAVLVPLRLGALDVVAASPEQVLARVAAASGPDPAPPGPEEVGQVLEAAAALRELLTNARPLEPADLAPSGGRPNAVVEAGGALTRLTQFAGQMATARAALDAAIAGGNPADLRAALTAADLLGTSQPVPAGDDLADLMPAARTARTELAGRLAADDAQQPVAERIRRLAEGRAWVLPALTPAAAFPGPPPAGAAPEELERHLMRAAAVRPAVARLDHVLGVVEALTAATPALSVTQWPLEAGERWVALDGAVKGGRTAVVAHAPAPAGATFAGLFVDEWTDVVPDSEVTTSIAFGYDAPSSAAPNVALLGARRPGAERWTADELAALVGEALDVARLRAVDSDTLASLAGQLLPPLVSRENPAPGVGPVLDVPTLTKPE